MSKSSYKKSTFLLPIRATLGRQTGHSKSANFQTKSFITDQNQTFDPNNSNIFYGLMDTLNDENKLKIKSKSPNSNKIKDGTIYASYDHEYDHDRKFYCDKEYESDDQNYYPSINNCNNNVGVDDEDNDGNDEDEEINYEDDFTDSGDEQGKKIYRPNRNKIYSKMGNRKSSFKRKTKDLLSGTLPLNLNESGDFNESTGLTRSIDSEVHEVGF